MKTLVLTLKEGFEKRTDYSYKRVEFLPIANIQSSTSNMYAFIDGKLAWIGGDIMSEADANIEDDDFPYLITWEEAKWL